VDETDPANPITHTTKSTTNTTNAYNAHTTTTAVNTDTTYHNADYTSTQSNTMHTTSGIQYKNLNQVNKSGRSKLQEKFFRMSSALCEVVDDFGLVSFHPMNIEDVEVSVGVHCVQFICLCCRCNFCAWLSEYCGIVASD